MKHTQENETGGRSSMRPNSASQKISDYFSSKINGSPLTGDYQETESLLQPGLSSRAQSSSQTHMKDNSSAILNIDKVRNDRREQKVAKESLKRFQKLMHAGERRRSQGTNRASFPQIKSSPAPKESPTALPLRRKPKFLKDCSKPDELALLKHNRDLMRSGHLEKVIPPPPSHLSPPKLQVSPSPTQRHSLHRKAESTSQKLHSYISTSASLLDETRREISTSLRRSAERALSLTLPINLPHSLDLDFRRSIIGDLDNSSDESFYCIGENREKSLDELDHERGLSGYGTSPWIDGMQEKCRLCEKGNPAGVRGLCTRCEKRLKQTAGDGLSEGEDNDEIKPTPPLKIRKASAADFASAEPKEVVGCNSNPFSHKNEIEAPPPPPPPKNSPQPAALELSRHRTNVETAQRSPQIVHMSKRVSMQAEIEIESPESEEEYGNRFERWQSKELRAEYERGEKEFARWSASLLKSPAESLAPVSRSTEGRMGGGKDQPKPSLKRHKGKGVMKLRRNSSFYEFWDDMLKTPRTGEE